LISSTWESSRACDKIPLTGSAQLVQVRPYHHTPALKDKIERQVAELLKSGAIQESTSAFTSPTILVQKKDLTWWLCIDYRRLNALIVPRKFPLPVIDELIDELTGADWFSKMDLHAGYHQMTNIKQLFTCILDCMSIASCLLVSRAHLQLSKEP
jgi:hypothetical protein